MLVMIKVDNWGTFFLQKLLNFFNKTDYCDLTLQFLDNSQLKVHRLVLSACTDYFNMLEQTCEMVEDILIMPKDLQADTILPIVNFMYTGSLEFHYSMYEKLLKTSREMNMTVLSKLLEAHRETSSVTKSPQPVLLNKNAAGANRSQPKVFHQKPLPTKTVIYKQGQTIIKHVSPNKSNIPEPIQIVSRYQTDKNVSRPSRFIVPDEVVVPDTEGSFESISYESKPLQTASQLKKEDENSTFENLRRGYTNKRATTGLPTTAPPSKKPNLDDIKELAEAQSQRNELITEDTKAAPQVSESIHEEEEASDDDDYDGDQYFDDEGSEDEYSKNQKNSPSTIVKQTTKQITVSDCSGGNIDHAKILGEVLKKYPNLVKNPKNIKLKIMQKPSQSNSSQTTAIVRVVKTDNDAKIVTSTPQQQQQRQQPKKIDAKTMHELIRLGAENQKGPWLCLECGTGGRPISIPTYKKFRAHLINVHKQKIDPRICEHCGLKPAKRIELIQHQLIAHNINPPSDVPLFRCTTKNCVFVTQKEDLLMKHKREVHKEFQQKCSYCSKVFNKEFLLHAHLRAVHRHKAKNDGMMDFSEDEEYEPAAGTSGSSVEQGNNGGNKIEILSNIEIPADQSVNIVTSSVISSSSEAEALSNVATGIATSLALVDNVVMDDQFNIEKQLAQMHNEYEDPKKEESTEIITRLVAEDGTEMVLTPEQKEEILQQLQQQGATLSDNVVMVLDQRQLNVEDQNNGIMVMLSEPTNSLTEPTDNISTTIKPEEIEHAEVVFQDGTVREKSDDESNKSRLKLIADLEDDWTEEMSQDEVKQPEDIITENDTEKVEEKIEQLEAKNETNEELNSLLQDWECDSKKIDESSEKIDEENKSVEDEVKDENNLETPENDSSPAIVEEKEPIDDEKIKDHEEKKDSPSNEKSKIITELLDEWNDL
ncbi:hypothetical protein ACKWTF_007388 [Chironomus riparius]